MPLTPITGNGHLTLGAGAAATLLNFPVLAATEVITGTTIANGVSTPFTTTSTIYYRSDNTAVATNTAGQLFLYLSVSYPATVRAGDTGSTGTGTQVNAGGSATAFGATITGAYFVATDSATSLLVTFVADDKNAFSGSETQTSTVYRIDTNGNVSLVSITAVQSFLGSVFQTLIFTF